MDLEMHRDKDEDVINDIAGHTEDSEESETQVVPSILESYLRDSTKVTFSGNTVYQNNSLINFDQQTSWRDGGKTVIKTNRDRMKTGRAAIGKDDSKSINLHHITQTQDSEIIELPQFFHQINFRDLHTNTGKSPSLINRGEFNTWRKGYWGNRKE